MQPENPEARGMGLDLDFHMRLDALREIGPRASHAYATSVHVDDLEWAKRFNELVERAEYYLHPATMPRADQITEEVIKDMDQVIQEKREFIEEIKKI